MIVRVKICGITNKDDALGVVEAGADALGFIFFTKSPRYIDPEKAAGIITCLPPFIDSVGVFVNEPLETVRTIAQQCRLSFIQLHGDETPDYCRRLDHRIIKAFRMTDNFPLESLRLFDVSGFLIDTAVKGQFGGTGKTFDWSRAVPAKRYGPVIVAGGLTPENITKAIAAAHPFAVDVSSGVESQPGKKDLQKVKTLIKRCKAVNQ